MVHSFGHAAWGSVLEGAKQAPARRDHGVDKLGFPSGHGYVFVIELLAERSELGGVLGLEQEALCEGVVPVRDVECEGGAAIGGDLFADCHKCLPF
jgi:hypothetical protein